MRKCPQCLGKGEDLCHICNGTKRDPRNQTDSCLTCSGKGYEKCNVCMGTGELDDNNDYRRT